MEHDLILITSSNKITSSEWSYIFNSFLENHFKMIQDMLNSHSLQTSRFFLDKTDYQYISEIFGDK